MSNAKKDIENVLMNCKTIAVIGYSTKEDRGGHYVPKYLREQGYTVYPVNPTVTEWEGGKVYASLADIPVKVDVVDCFRKPDAMPEIAREAVAAGAKVLWMQKEIESEEAAKIARDAGMTVIQNVCMLEQHKELMGSGATCSLTPPKK